MRRKKIYLLLELAVLFLIFVQYMVNLTIDEKKKGQVIVQENKEKQKDNKKKEQELKEVVSQDLAYQIENENNSVLSPSHSSVSQKEEEQAEEIKEEKEEETVSKKEETIRDPIEKTQFQAKTQKIRVLLKTTGYKGNYHDSVKVIPSEDCILSILDNPKKTKILKAGKSFIFKDSSSWLKKGTILLSPKKNGKIKIGSIRRSCGDPSYRGTLELTKTKQGIVVVNELLLEEYLYSVVPSEMPVSYGIEALKVQAVCARCYAYSQLGSSAMEEFHADVDDSTSYQVYNNVAETQDSKKAVDATIGLVPVSKDKKMITAYYYSTSCGYTANIHDAWEKEERKEDKEDMETSGSNYNSYLIGKPQFIKSKEAEKSLDLSKEKNFLDFLKKETRQTYDSTFPWYRWTVSISSKALQDSIKENLEERQLANPSMVELIGKDIVGEENNLEIKDLGEWKGIELVHRSMTGMVTCIKIIYSKGEILVYGEYNIRCLLSPGDAKIRRQDGSVISNLSLLPSSFFSMKKKDGNYVFIGGGYGHGVGMSQNGVKTMVEKGYTWKEVLKHYYQGIQIENIEKIFSESH